MEAAGYKVLTAGDGEEAMRVFDKNRDRVSLAVLDAIMPKYTGHQVHNYIKQISPDTPIVFCTGYDPELTRSQGGVGDDVPLVQKPFCETFLSVVRKTLDATRQKAANPSQSS